MVMVADSLISVELQQIKNNINCDEINFPIGKMIRSTIGLLLVKSLGLKISEDYLNLFSAIELIHNASLIHDDVIDDEIERRNDTSLNSLYDNKTAILYGNLLLTEAVQFLLKISSQEVLSVVNSSIRNMCKGELLQKSLLFTIPTMEDYIEKSSLKTASLFVGMAQSINIIANANSCDLIKFAENFGIAFQIKNDLEDYVNDVKNGIYTAPIIYANSVNFDNIAIEKTLSLIDNYTISAKKLLCCLRESEYKDSLIGVIECLMK